MTPQEHERLWATGEQMLAAHEAEKALDFIISRADSADPHVNVELIRRARSLVAAFRIGAARRLNWAYAPEEAL